MPLGPTDTCTRCVSAAVAPYDVEIDPGGMRAWYLHCGLRWHTGWLLTPEEMTAYESEAA